MNGLIQQMIEHTICEIENRSRNKKCERPFLSVFLGNMSLKGLYDTGADISCLNDRVFRKISPDQRPPRIVENNRSIFRAANGDPLEVRGLYHLKLRMGKSLVEHPFFVVKNLSEDMILGIDFIHQHNLNYNATAKSFRWKGGPSWTEGHLKTCKALTIEALGSQFVKMQVRTESGAIPAPSQACMVTVVSQDNPFITGGPFLVEPDENGHVQVLVTNCSPIPVDLGRNEFLGMAENLEDSQLREISASYLNTVAQKMQTKEPTPISPEKKKFILANLNLQQIPDQFKDRYKRVILKHHEAISQHKLDLGRTNTLLHDIELRSPEPIYVKQFKIPDAHRLEVEKHVAEWLKLGVVQPARSKFNSPLFAVAKKNGGIRLVQDFRALNAQTFVDKYSMKDVTECIGEIGRSGSTIFTTIDLTAGFWQLLLHPKSRPYTAFTVPGKGQFQWVTTPMGLLGAPSSFQRLMEKVVHGIQNVLVYIDDLLVHSESHEQHLHLLDQVLGRLEAHHIKMNLEKCVFGAREVAYLGFHLTPEGIKPGSDKLKAVAKAPVPTTVREVRQFLGLCNFFRNHVKNFAQVSAPLTKLTRKDSPWKSGPLPDEALQAFRELQTHLVSEPVVAYPKRNRPYALITDASLGDDLKPGGLGAILTQIDENQSHQVIAYASRKLQKFESNYTPFLLEMQAALWGMEHFSNYLRGRHFTLFSDHKPLEKLGKVHSKTLNRLQEAMNSYDFEIRYKKGEEMPADFLSRNVVSAIGWSNEEINKLQEKDPLIFNLKQFLLHRQVHPDPTCRSLVRHLADESFIDEDLVWKRVKRPGEPSRAVLYLPYQLKEKILTEAHGSILAGHDGVLKTKERIFSTYYWPGMDKDINEHIQTCHRCQVRRKTNPQAPALLSPLPQCSEPGQRVHADLFGPLKTSGQGKKFILCMTDAFTKYVELVAIPNKESATVAKAIFEKWICRFGVPLTIITDQGREFVGQLTKDLFTLLKIEHNTTSAYHPQCNSQAEVANKTIAKYLSSFVDDSTLDWEDYLWPLMFCYNTSFHRSTHNSPFYLTFGMEPRDNSFSAGDLRRKFYGESSTDDLIQRLRVAREVAQHHNQDATDTYKRYHDTKAEPHPFLRGQKVLLQENFFLGKNVKLSPKWSGPHEIIRLIGDANVELKLSTTNRKLICHVNRLKPYNFALPKNSEASSNRLQDIDDEVEKFSKPNLEADLEATPSFDAEPPFEAAPPSRALFDLDYKLHQPIQPSAPRPATYADKLRTAAPHPKIAPDVLLPQSERPSMIQVRLNSFPAASSSSNLASQDSLPLGGIQQQQIISNILEQNDRIRASQQNDIDDIDDGMSNDDIDDDWIVVVGKKKLRPRQPWAKWNRYRQQNFRHTGDSYDMSSGYKESIALPFFDPVVQQAQQQPVAQQQQVPPPPPPLPPPPPVPPQQVVQPQQPVPPVLPQQPAQQPQLPKPNVQPQQQQQHPLQPVVLPGVGPKRPQGILKSPSRFLDTPGAVASPDPHARRSGVLRQSKFIPQSGPSQILARLPKGPTPEGTDPEEQRPDLASTGAPQPPSQAPTGVREEGAAGGQPVGRPTTAQQPSTRPIPPYLQRFDEIDDSLLPRSWRRSSRRTDKLPEDVLHKYPEERKKK